MPTLVVIVNTCWYASVDYTVQYLGKASFKKKIKVMEFYIMALEVYPAKDNEILTIILVCT